MADPQAVSRELIPDHLRRERPPDPGEVVERTTRGADLARALLEERDVPAQLTLADQEQP